MFFIFRGCTQIVYIGIVRQILAIGIDFLDKRKRLLLYLIFRQCVILLSSGYRKGAISRSFGLKIEF